MQLLIIFTEIHISKLHSTSCLHLYTTSYEVFSLYNNRLHIYISKAEQIDEESILFRNESCLYILELLNHLASKDFAFTEDCAENINEQFQNQIIIVLLHGFKLIFPIITIETMKNFPQTSEKFFSFLTFLLSSYIVNIVQWLNSLSIEENQNMLYQIIMRLYYGSCMVDAPIARLSLQVSLYYILLLLQLLLLLHILYHHRLYYI